MDSIRPLDVDEPTTVGPYRLLGRLGAGGMGRVHLGRSAGGRTVAVKIVHPHFALDQEFRARPRPRWPGGWLPRTARPGWWLPGALVELVSRSAVRLPNLEAGQDGSACSGPVSGTVDFSGPSVDGAPTGSGAGPADGGASARGSGTGVSGTGMFGTGMFGPPPVMPVPTVSADTSAAEVPAPWGPNPPTEPAGGVCDDVLTLKQVTEKRLVATSVGAMSNRDVCDQARHTVHLTPTGDDLVYESDSKDSGSPRARLSKIR